MLAATIISCGNTSGVKGDEARAETKIAENKITDPVCGMPKEADMQWTDYSLNRKDTVWFCSPHCKETYDKDPSKFTKK